MKREAQHVLLRVFVDTFQRWHHRPVYEALVEQAQRKRLGGATVLESLEGFGQSGEILRESLWSLANRREVVVEIVDTPEQIESYLASVEPMLRDALVTLERADVVIYRAEGKGAEA